MNGTLLFPKPELPELVVSLRLLCRKVERGTRPYFLLKALTSPIAGIYERTAPEKYKWYYTPPGVDGWEFLEEHNLSKTALHSLWEDEALEIQEIDATGAWNDTFTL